MSDFPSILPPNRTRAEAALEQALHQGKPDLRAVSTLIHPDTCPAELLGWLAWSFSVDTYSSTWREEVKRRAIRNSIAIHRVKGTLGAVRKALASIGFRTDIAEWFDTGDAPHTFRIDAFGEDVFGAGFDVDARLLNTLSRMIDDIKPARAHYTLRIGESFEADTYLRSGIRAARMDRRELVPVPPTQSAKGTVFVRSGLRLHRVDRHEHTPAPRGERTKGVMVARSGSRARIISRVSHDFEVKEGAAYAV